MSTDTASRLRAATPADAESLSDIFIAARAGMTYLPHLHSEQETRAFIASLVSRLEVIVADLAGASVGFAALDGPHLDHLYIAPSAQGKGIGAGLLAEVKRRRPGGFSLYVFQQNAGARRFYERHGLVCTSLSEGSRNEERLPDAQYSWSG